MDGAWRRGDALTGGPGDDRLEPGYDSRYGELSPSDADNIRYEDEKAAVEVDLLLGTAQGAAPAPT